MVIDSNGFHYDDEGVDVDTETINEDNDYNNNNVFILIRCAAEIPTTEEHKRLLRHMKKEADWKDWGPYLSERAWASVREDYSPSTIHLAFIPVAALQNSRYFVSSYRWRRMELLSSRSRQKVCLHSHSQRRVKTIDRLRKHIAHNNHVASVVHIDGMKTVWLGSVTDSRMSVWPSLCGMEKTPI